jgi:hypothetical protein
MAVVNKTDFNPLKDDIALGEPDRQFSSTVETGYCSRCPKSVSGDRLNCLLGGMIIAKSGTWMS